MKKTKMVFAFLTVFICTVIFAGTGASAEEYRFSYESVKQYINTDSGKQQIKSVIEDSLKKYFLTDRIDEVSVGKPFKAACYYEKTHKTTENASRGIYCGLYRDDKLFGFLRFYTNDDKTAPYCYECVLLTPEIIGDTEENVVLFFTADTDKYEIQSGGAGENYMITDNGTVKLVSSAYRLDAHPFEDYFEDRQLSAVKYKSFWSIAHIPLEITDSIAVIEIEHTADKNCYITDGDGKYLTRSESGYILTDKIENDKSRIFSVENISDGKASITNLKTERKLRLKGSSEFYIFQTDCGEEYADYIDGGIVTAIVNSNGYALTRSGSRVGAAEYDDSYLTSENQSWFLEKAD